MIRAVPFNFRHTAALFVGIILHCFVRHLSQDRPDDTNFESDETEDAPDAPQMAQPDDVAPDDSVDDSEKHEQQIVVKLFYNMLPTPENSLPRH